CMAQPSGKLTSPMLDNFRVVVQVPDGWIAESNGRFSETEMLVLDAPANYSYQPTRIRLLSLLGFFPSGSAADLARNFYGGSSHPGTAPVKLNSQVTGCKVGDDDAAF